MPRLALTRKAGERIQIGGDVHVEVVSVSGRKVRLLIEAPGDVPIFRQELLPLPAPVSSSTATTAETEPAAA